MNSNALILSLVSFVPLMSLPVTAVPESGEPPPIVTQADGAGVLEVLQGEWEGDGELLGRAATFTMTWTKALGDKFLRLEFHNAFADVDPIQPVLGAHAYYLIGETELTGRWMDSRGTMLELNAKIVGSALVTDWSGAESGRTEYRVIGENTVEVVDSVLSEGEYHQFGRATYRRAAAR